jgi:hypothetical protein
MGEVGRIGLSMIVTLLDEDLGLTEHLGVSSGPRTRDVLHLSDIYKVLMQRLQPKRFDASKPMDMKRVEIGLLYETMLEQGLAEKYSTVRPGEIVGTMINAQGHAVPVYMSPDGVNPDLMAGEEYKATYMSSKDGITEDIEAGGVIYQVPRDKFVHWFVQCKGYAKWLEVNRFILRVLFLCGDYSYPIGPQFKSYSLEFTDEEIEDNWTMLRTVAIEEGLI